MKGMVTLKSACKEALLRGYRTIETNGTYIRDDLTEFSDDLEEGGAEEYTIFGCFIIRMTDAWKEDPELYNLDY